MPIVGLTENRRLPRRGKIHLGIKKQSASGKGEYPSATDYFVVPPDVAAIVGEKPTELPIMIPLEDDELWASQYYKRYSRTRGLVCKGDGITCRRMIDTATGDVANRDTKEVVWKEGMSCEGKECSSYKAKECKEVMNLQFMMPDVPGIGVWQIDTSSINSIRNINSAAAMIRVICKRLTMLPLLLTLEPIEVVNPDDGKKKLVRVLNLRANGTMRELMLQAAKPTVELLLPAPVEDEAPLDVEDKEPVKLAAAATSTPPPVKEPPAKAQSQEEAFEKLGQEREEKKPDTEGIENDWLKEAMKKLKWRNEGTMITWMVANNYCTKTKTLAEALKQLLPEAKAKMVKQIQGMVDAAGE